MCLELLGCKRYACSVLSTGEAATVLQSSWEQDTYVRQWTTLSPASAIALKRHFVPALFRDCWEAGLVTVADGRRPECCPNFYYPVALEKALPNSQSIFLNFTVIAFKKILNFMVSNI